MSQQERLQLGRRYLKTFVLDELLKPVDNEDLVVIVDVSDVSGVQPAFLVYGSCCGLRVVEISWKLGNITGLVD